MFRFPLSGNQNKKNNLCALCVSAVGIKFSTAFHTTASGSVLTLDPGLNNIGGTPNPGSYSDSVSRTIFGTGAALHTAVQILNPSFFIVHEKDAMGAHNLANAATHTFFFIQSQGRHIGKISNIFHLQILKIDQSKLIVITTKITKNTKNDTRRKLFKNLCELRAFVVQKVFEQKTQKKQR